MKKGNIKSKDGTLLGKYTYDSSGVVPFILVNVLETTTKLDQSKDGVVPQTTRKAVPFTDLVNSWEEAKAFIESQFNQEVLLKEEG